MMEVDGADPKEYSAEHWMATTALLSAVAAPSGREAAWDQVSTFLRAGNFDGTHLVASVVVVDGDGLVLLARHRRYGQWGPLGGHLERQDATLSATAARELFEEAGLVAHVQPALIDVRLSSYPCRTVDEPALHLDVQFVAVIETSDQSLVASEELTGLEWFGADDLSALTPAAVELFHRARSAAFPR